MINIDVLLQAAEFIESQQQFQLANDTKRHISSYMSNESSLLSPSSYSSSSSSSSLSCSSSASPETVNGVPLLTPIQPLVYHNHKKFNKRVSKDLLEQKVQNYDATINFFNTNQMSPNSKAPNQHHTQYNRSSPVNTMSPNALISIPSPLGGCGAGSLGSSSSNGGTSFSYGSSSIPFPSPSLSSSSSSSVYSFSCNDTSKSHNNNNKVSTCFSNSSSRLDEIKRDKAIHNTLEKNRRAHLKERFEKLQNELPQYRDKKVTNLLILNYTLKYVEQSKKKERDNELDKHRLARRQTQLKQTLQNLLTELESEKSFDLQAWLENNKQTQNIDNNDSQDDSFNDSIKSEQRVVCEENSTGGIRQRHSSSKCTKKSANVYQRKRCSNSLSMTGNPKVSKSNAKQHHSNSNSSTDDTLNRSQQAKLLKTSKQLQKNKQRHYSFDENMINHECKRQNSNSINQDETTQEMNDYFYEEDDIDDIDNDEELSNYDGNWNEEDDCDVENGDNNDNDDSSGLMIDEDTIEQQHTTVNSELVQNKALKLLSINDAVSQQQSKFNFKIIENIGDSTMDKKTTKASFTTDNLTNSATKGRSRNSSLSIDNQKNISSNNDTVKQTQQQQQNIDNLNAITYSKSLISQINNNTNNGKNSFQPLNSNGTAKFVLVKNNNNDPNTPPSINTPKSIIQLNQQAFLPHFLSNGSSSNNHQNIARDIIAKNIFQQQQQNQFRLKPLEQLFNGQVLSNVTTSNNNNFNLPPQNLINVPFFKSISIQNANNNPSSQK